MNAEDQANLRSHLQKEFKGKKTVLETIRLIDQGDGGLTYAAEGYRVLFEKTMKGNNILPPSHIDPIIEVLANRFENLLKAIEDLPEEARLCIYYRAASIDALEPIGSETLTELNAAHVTEWFSIPRNERFGDGESDMTYREPKAEDSRLLEIKPMIHFLRSIRAPRNETHSDRRFLLSYLCLLIGRLKRPKGHVLEIAQAIHRWATGNEISEAWGESFIDERWQLWGHR